MNALKCKTLGVRACAILESARTRSLITFTRSIRKTFGKRRRQNRKKLATLYRIVVQVEFSLLLAFLGPLEGSAVEKVRGMSLQYPTTQEAVYLMQRSGFREIPTNFWTFVAC